MRFQGGDLVDPWRAEIPAGSYCTHDLNLRDGHNYCKMAR